MNAGKVVLVSGAGSGIGAAIVGRLLGEGWRVVALDVAVDALSTLSETASEPAALRVQRCDVSDETAVVSALEATLSYWGRLDALITVAGVLHFARGADTSLSMWERLLAVNLTGTFLLCRAALRHLVVGGGSIVTTASTAALAGLAYGSAYAASKGGVIAYSRALAVEYARQGVRVNCVCPGGVDTPMTQGLAFPEGVDMSLIQRQLPLLAAAQPDALTGIYSHLVSDDARHITGEVIRVDGGMLA